VGLRSLHLSKQIMFGIKNAGFNVREQVANLIVLLALIASAGPCVLAKINPGAGSLVEFQRHLAYLKTDAERERVICLCQHNSEPYAISICKAENLTEKGMFGEAASVLAHEAEKWASPCQQSLIEQRLAILKKWAREGQISLEDYSLFYLGNACDRSQARAGPIIALSESRRYANKAKYSLLAEMLERRGDLEGQALALRIAADWAPHDSEASSGLLLAAGNAFYESGDKARAIEVWQRIISEPHRTSEWPKAMYNLGLGEQKRGNFRQAMKYFDLLLESHPNDKEPGQNIMEVYRNYSHRSALQLSLCYEKIGDLNNALRYARLAKTSYPYHSWCGTCIYLDTREVDKRIAYLLARQHPLTFALVVALCLQTLLP